MENNNSLVVVRGNIILETNAANYEKLLQAAENITFDKNDLAKDYVPLKELREIKKRLDEKKNPHTEAWQTWNKSMKSIIDPIEAILKKKSDEFTKLATEIKKEQEQAQAAKDELNRITNLIQSVKIEFSQSIAASNTVGELVAIEKQIGAEKRKTTTYKNQLPDLIIALDELRPLIVEQKEIIKKLTLADHEQKQAELSGSDEQLLQAIENKLALETQIDQSKTNIQHVALNSALKTESVESESTTVLPKAKRTTWEWEVVDIKYLQRMFPKAVKLIVDEKEVNAIIKDLKDKKEISEHIHWCGLKIYQKSTY